MSILPAILMLGGVAATVFAKKKLSAKTEEKEEAAPGVTPQAATAPKPQDVIVVKPQDVVAPKEVTASIPATPSSTATVVESATVTPPSAPTSIAQMHALYKGAGSPPLGSIAYKQLVASWSNNFKFTLWASIGRSMVSAAGNPVPGTSAYVAIAKFMNMHLPSGGVKWDETLRSVTTATSSGMSKPIDISPGTKSLPQAYALEGVGGCSHCRKG